MMIKTKNRQERIFELIKSIGISNAEKQSIVRTRYNRKQVCHLTADQGIDLEDALTTAIASAKDKQEALEQLLVKQQALWTENPLFPVSF